MINCKTLKSSAHQVTGKGRNVVKMKQTKSSIFCLFGAFSFDPNGYYNPNIKYNQWFSI